MRMQIQLGENYKNRKSGNFKVPVVIFEDRRPLIELGLNSMGPRDKYTKFFVEHDLKSFVIKFLDADQNTDWIFSPRLLGF